MSNLFVFICGMNPNVYACISGELQKIVDLDCVTRQYRTDIYSDYDARRKLESYQSMQVQCLQESARNGYENCSVYLNDILVGKHIPTDDLTTLKIIINLNKCNVKSLLLSYPDEKITEFVLSLDPGVFTSLDTLEVLDCDKEPVWLAYILNESARTLTCLTLLLSGRSSLSGINITALTGLKCLQSLHLAHVHMTHSNIKCLYAYINQTTTLTQLKLAYIDCPTHKYPCRDCDVTLDLHRLNQLKMLHLYDVRCSKLQVNPKCLEKLEFWPQGEVITASSSATLWQNLRGAPILSSLTLWFMTSCKDMIQTIPTLTQLHYLRLVGIDIGDVILCFSPAMTKLERVELWKVRMSANAWKELFLSVVQLPNPVKLEIDECNGLSREEWQTFVDEFKSTHTLSLLQDLSIDDSWGYASASLTLKKQ